MTLHSEQFNEIAAALAKAQGAMSNADKNASNPHFKSKYADLAAVREATVPHLAANGIAIVQQIQSDEGGMVLRSTLIHSSGQWLASVFPVPQMQRVQELGSYITYARRYSWMGLCGIAPEDDDGNAANTAKPPPQRPESPVKLTPKTATLPAHDPQTGETGPREIAEPKSNGVAPSIAWGQLFLSVINDAKSKAEVDAWCEKNDKYLNYLQENEWKVYQRIDARIDAVRAKFAPKADPAASPTPQEPEAWLDWIFENLKSRPNAEDRASWWEKHIDPVLDTAFPSDQKEAWKMWQEFKEGTA